MPKTLKFLHSLILFIVTILDITATGLFTLLISSFSANREKRIYEWTRGWGKRGLNRYGITIKVIGEEHWQNAKKIILLANHQSTIEALLLSKFIRDDLKFVGKKSLKWIPVFGALYLLSKQILLDRYHHEKALKGMEEARRKIEEGYSIFLAPEGTRSLHGELGKIKKGFFHLAIQTRTPILPMTFVNAYKIQPKHSIIINPTEALIVFDPLIVTKDWKVEEIDLRIEEIRRIYQNNLNKYGDPCQTDFTDSQSYSYKRS